MDLDKYKQRLREEILEFGRVYGVRKTCREAGISHDTWSRLRWGEIAHVETLEKILSKIKTSCNAPDNQAHKT